MPFTQFILKLMQESREWVKLLLPAFLAWHLNPPKWKKDVSKEEG